MTFTLQEKLACVEKLKGERATWLQSFSSGKNKRPDHEIASKRSDVSALESIAQDYRNAIARKAEGEAAA